MKTIVVSAGIVIEQGRILLTQRKPDAHLAGAWEFPGGKVETGEDPREALRRELKEEVGIDVVVGEIVDVAFHRYLEADRAVILLFFEAERTACSPHPQPLDVADIKWSLASELRPEEFPPADLVVLQKVMLRLNALAAEPTGRGVPHVRSL